MEKRIAYLVLFLFIANAMCVAAENVFVLEIAIFKTDSVELQSFELLDGKVNIYASSPGEYTLKIISSENSDLFIAELPLQFYVYADEVDEHGNLYPKKVELEKVEKFLRLPYFQNAERIELLHNEKVIFSLDIKEKLCAEDGTCLEYCVDKNDPDCEISTSTTTAVFITTTTSGCGNKFCERNENFATCPQDCSSGGSDNYCDGAADGICDPDCKPEFDPDCKVDLCGNGICDVAKGENFLNCREDCNSGSQDDYCDKMKDNICDPDCLQSEDPDCAKTNLPLYLFLFVGAVVVIFVILFFIRKRRSEY